MTQHAQASHVAINLCRTRRDLVFEVADDGCWMEPGPSTVHPHTPAGKLAKRLAARDLKTAIVTAPEGVLVGVVRRRDLEGALTQHAGRPATA